MTIRMSMTITVAPRNFGETWPLSPYCVGGEKTVLCPRIDPLSTFRVHQDMICTRDVIEAVSLGLVLAPVFVRGIAIMPDRKDNITSFSGGLPFWADND